MSEPHSPERRQQIADDLQKLGVSGILLTAAQEGLITELACAMPKCYCPEELGGKTHFEPIPEPLSDWIPTQDHKKLKSEGGKLTVDNVRLAHRLCNRIHFNEVEGRSVKGDLARVEAARTTGPIPPRFNVMAGEDRIDAARTYEEALERALGRADRIEDVETGAVISMPHSSSDLS